MAPADARNQRANRIIEPNDDNTWTARHETVNSSISLLLPPPPLSIYRVLRELFLQFSNFPNNLTVWKILWIFRTFLHVAYVLYICARLNFPYKHKYSHPIVKNIMCVYDQRLNRFTSYLVARQYPIATTLHRSSTSNLRTQFVA